MVVGESRSMVLAVPPAWANLSEGEPEVKINVTIRELLEYRDLPEVG